ncbi:MAG TPA: hypothetical protein VHX42_00690 [Candidatus Babeliales bacterium]|jgi:hypothetical protein|nr:hypothetical protein [Candidatus Babeliales bacterium]
MKSIRIFFLVSVTLASIFITASTEHLKTWQTTYLNAMTPEELRFTANFLYLSNVISIIESKIRQFNSPLLRLNQSIRVKIANYTDYKEITDDLVMLKTLLDRLSYITGARTIYMEMYNTCQKQLNLSEMPTVQAALESIQQNAQIELRAWADEKINTTTEQLKKSRDIIGQSAQYLASISGAYDGISKGDLPIEITSENENNKSLITFNMLLHSTPQLITLTENLADTFNETYDNAAQIITVGSEIYKQYYAVIHHLIMSPTSDKQYAMTMFGMYDVLPEEHKTLLPDAQNIFSHALETTKLYTQAEFIQQ